MYTKLHGDLYVDRSVILEPKQRIATIVSSAPDDVVVGGIAAKIMHGGLWFDGDFTVELVRAPASGNKPGRGRAVRRRELAVGDIVEIDGIAVTSVVRTAFDLARMAPEWRALGHLDDLMRVAAFSLEELDCYAKGFSGYRGVRQLRGLIPLIDGLAESPPESWVRLMMHRADLPTPGVQVVVLDDSGHGFARIDLAYEHLKIGIEYDGEEFHSTPEQRARDEARDAKLRAMGWIIIHIDAERLRTDQWGIILEIEQALRSRGGYF